VLEKSFAPFTKSGNSQYGEHHVQGGVSEIRGRSDLERGLKSLGTVAYMGLSEIGGNY
jgi:hypothetical protein